MAKILLVEDDNNLREIYEARLQAEGYTIVSAHDGEEALVVAKAERPDLIISDVMMPKISGFEMLDILRNTDSLKGVKVIMLTALGQSDDQQRANKLGADRYLVKSQVTLEDIVNEANALLQPGTKPVDATMPSSSQAKPQEPTASPAPPEPNGPTTDLQAPQSSTAVESPASEPPSVVGDSSIGAVNPSDPPATPVPVTAPPEPPSEPVSDTPKVPDISPGLAESASTEEGEVKSQIEDFAKNVETNSTPATPPTENPVAESEPKSVVAPKDANEPFLTPADKEEDAAAGYSPQPVGKKVIEPLPESQSKPDINQLLEKEKAKELMDDVKPQSPDAAPTMSAADTAPAPPSPVISPDSTSNPGDPNNVAL